MNNEDKVMAPKLVNGLFFRVRRNTKGYVIVELRSKKWFGSYCVRSYGTGNKQPTKESILEAMELLAERHNYPPDRYLGDYPPKEFIE